MSVKHVMVKARSTRRRCAPPASHNGSGAAAGWPSGSYWTGELGIPSVARLVKLSDGFGFNGSVDFATSVVCGR